MEMQVTWVNWDLRKVGKNPIKVHITKPKIALLHLVFRHISFLGFRLTCKACWVISFLFSFFQISWIMLKSHQKHLKHEHSRLYKYEKAIPLLPNLYRLQSYSLNKMHSIIHKCLLFPKSVPLMQELNTLNSKI